MKIKIKEFNELTKNEQIKFLENNPYYNLGCRRNDVVLKFTDEFFRIRSERFLKFLIKNNYIVQKISFFKNNNYGNYEEIYIKTNVSKDEIDRLEQEFFYKLRQYTYLLKLKENETFKEEKHNEKFEKLLSYLKL